MLNNGKKVPINNAISFENDEPGPIPEASKVHPQSQILLYAVSLFTISLGRPGSEDTVSNACKCAQSVVPDCCSDMMFQQWEAMVKVSVSIKGLLGVTVFEAGWLYVGGLPAASTSACFDILPIVDGIFILTMRS